MRFAAPCIHLRIVIIAILKFYVWDEGTYCHNNILFHASLQHLKLIIPWLVCSRILACRNGGGHCEIVIIYRSQNSREKYSLSCHF
jgi:hypothetical protein